MNQLKIGKFIADMRKEQELTQKQLADLLSTTDKTISKWETGVRIPDSSMLLPLCEVLKIDVNELLIGERIEEEEYAKTAENNVVNLVNELNDISENSKGKKVGTVIGGLFIILALVTMMTLSFEAGGMLNLLDFPTLCYLLGLDMLVIAITGWFHPYCTAWKICFRMNNRTEICAEKAVYAVKFTSYINLAIGGLVSMTGLIATVGNIDNIGATGPSLAQTVLALLYTILFELIHIILLYSLKKK